MIQETRIKLGFTLIELMVAITIAMLLVGGVAVALTKYHNTEKLNGATQEIRSLISMARNLAVTNQTPEGFGGDLGYVLVHLGANGKIEAWPYNSVVGVGASYFSRNTADNRITTVMNDDLRFAAGTGKILDSFGNPLPSNGTVTIVITSADADDNQQIVVSSLGIIK